MFLANSLFAHVHKMSHHNFCDASYPWCLHIRISWVFKAAGLLLLTIVTANKMPVLEKSAKININISHSCTPTTRKFSNWQNMNNRARRARHTMRWASIIYDGQVDMAKTVCLKSWLTCIWVSLNANSAQIKTVISDGRGARRKWRSGALLNSKWKQSIGFCTKAISIIGRNILFLFISNSKGKNNFFIVMMMRKWFATWITQRTYQNKHFHLST